MKEVNLNIDHWSMVTDHEPAETVYIHADLISLLDDISNANTDDVLEINMHEYTH